MPHPLTDDLCSRLQHHVSKRIFNLDRCRRVWRDAGLPPDTMPAEASAARFWEEALRQAQSLPLLQSLLTAATDEESGWYEDLSVPDFLALRSAGISLDPTLELKRRVQQHFRQLLLTRGFNPEPSLRQAAHLRIQLPELLTEADLMQLETTLLEHFSALPLVEWHMEMLQNGAELIAAGRLERHHPLLLGLTLGWVLSHPASPRIEALLIDSGVASSQAVLQQLAVLLWASRPALLSAHLSPERHAAARALWQDLTRCTTGSETTLKHHGETLVCRLEPPTSARPMLNRRLTEGMPGVVLLTSHGLPSLCCYFTWSETPAGPLLQRHEAPH